MPRSLIQVDEDRLHQCSFDYGTHKRPRFFLRQKKNSATNQYFPEDVGKEGEEPIIVIKQQMIKCHQELASKENKKTDTQVILLTSGLITKVANDSKSSLGPSAQTDNFPSQCWGRTASRAEWCLLDVNPKSLGFRLGPPSFLKCKIEIILLSFSS